MNSEETTTKAEGVNGQTIAAPCSSHCYPNLRGRYMPLDPVALSTNSVGVRSGPFCVSAIVGDNAALMENVARLWICETDTVVDVTFGRGVFWRRLAGLPHHAHDIAKDGVDCRDTPHRSGSVDVVAFDPPYRPTHGSRGFGENGLAGAYQVGGESLDTINDVVALYAAGLAEAARILRTGGRVLVKCQDMSYANRLHLVTLDVLRALNECGFDLADQFVLVNGGNLRSPKWRQQQRARRTHSVLWVGVKAIG